MRVGNVTLDETFYSGKDLYTDGEIEERMLGLARCTPPDRLGRLPEQEKSWPVLYHFSPIRENIVGWLPFTGKEKVLEIGAGCGAVTGVLCRMSGQVTALDLSRKRSLINAHRHADAENLTIILGNFEDIEPSLDRDYDYITLIGVFEYAAGYIHSSAPYEDFLKKVAAHLAPGGRIVLAIENRFGLKYWAGCAEDHTGRLFDGLENYPLGGSARTFTRPELEEILEKAGDLHALWYYPFPDYKLPTTIYSDARLPERGELNRTEYNFDRLRLSLFEESAVYDSVLKNGLYPMFANSYLLLITRKEISPEILYSRFSAERRPECRLRTDILVREDGSGQREVAKTAMSPTAVPFAESLPEKTTRFDRLCRETGMKANACRSASEGKILLEYLEGESLESALDRTLEEKGPEAALLELLSWAERLRNMCEKESFYPCPEFREIFGEAGSLEGIRGVSWCSIDIVPANILMDRGLVTVLDAEWTFPFVIPAGFFVYRFIHYYVHSDSKRARIASLAPEEKAGLTEREQQIYAGMEMHFQKWMLGGMLPLRCLYPAISPGKADACAFYGQACSSVDTSFSLQVFYDRGAGFREEDSFRYRMGDEVLEIPIPVETHRLRLDPGEEGCCVRILELKWDHKRRAVCTTNGIALSEDTWGFGPDPQIILEQVPPDIRMLCVALERTPFPRTASQVMDSLQNEKSLLGNRVHELEQEVLARDEEIRRMKQTKAWKLYRKIRP